MIRSTRREAAGLSPRTRTRALVLVAGAALSTAAFVQSAGAQTTWAWGNNATNGNGGTVNWSTASWSPSGPPTGSADAALVFNYDFGANAQIAKDDIAGAFALNSLTVNTDSAAGGSGQFTLNSATTAGGLSFTNSSLGAGPTLNLMGAQASQFASSSSLPIALQAPLTFQGSGFGNITMGSVISGNFGLNFNTTGPGVVLFQNGFNTFVGPVTINSGEVGVGNAQAFGSAANPITINGGTIRIVTGTTFNGPITLNSDLRLTGTSSSTLTLMGAMSGSSGVSLHTYSSPTLSLQANNTFSGAYSVQAFGGSTGTVSSTTSLSGAAGAMSGASSFTLTDNHTMQLDNSSAVNNDRLRDTAPIALNRSTLSLMGNTASATSETVGAITITGGSTLLANSSTTTQQNSTLTAASISRSDRGTLFVRGANLGTTAAAGVAGANIVSAGLAGDLVGGGGASGSSNISILPYAFGVSFAVPVSGTSTASAQLLTYDATNGIRPLTAAEYASTYQSQGSASSNNLRSNNVVIGGSTQANAVVLDTAMVSLGGAATTASGLYMKPGSVLTPTSGVVLTSISSTFGTGLLPSTLPSIIAGGTLDFGGTEGIVHAQNNTAILSMISGSQGLTKAGDAGLILAPGNTFTGPVTINGGSVAVDSDSALGNASNGLTLASGGNNGNAASGLAFAPSVLLGSSMQQSLTVPRNVTLAGSGGALGSTLINGTLTASGVISGSGSLYAGSATSNGVLKLTGANTYTGSTVIFSPLAVNSDANLGSGSEIVFDNGYLRNDGPLTTSKNMVVVGQGLLLTNGADMTLSGQLMDKAGPGALILAKGGTNNLTLTAASAFNGTLIIGQNLTSSFPLAAGQSSFVTGGTITLSGAGALPSVPSLNINGSSTLTLDNTGTNNTNRISSNINIGGGTLNFLGNGSAASSETIGQLVFGNTNSGATANGTAVININPGSGQSAVLRLSDVSRGPNNTLLVRGTNLGASAPGAADTANMMLNTSTTGALSATNFANGCIGGVVVDTSLSGSGSDLANYDAIKGIVAATYGANDTLGAAINSNLTANNVLAAATSANAIRMNEPAGGIDTNGKILTMGAPATILAIGPTPKTIAATGGGSIAFPASSTATFWNNSDLTVNAPLTGLIGLNKSGTGTLTLNAASAGTTTVVSNGTLKLGAANVLPTTSALVVGSQDGSVGTLDLNGFAVTASSLTGIGTVIDNGSLTLTGTGTNPFPGKITGSGGLTISSSMTLNGGSSDYAGDTTVRNSGVLTIAADQGVSSGPLGSGANLIVGDATTTASVTVLNNVSVINKNFVYPFNTVATAPAFTPVTGNSVFINGTVTMGRNVALSGNGGSLTSSAYPFTGKTVTYTGTIQDDTVNSRVGTFEWAGGCINLMGNNTFTGGVNAHPGSADPETCFLGIGNNNALGTGTIRATGAASGNLVALSGARTISNGLYWTAAPASRMGFAGVNDLTLSGNVDLGGGFYGAASPASVAGPRSWNVINAGTTTISGSISGQSAATLTKTGDGKLVMSGANTFAGNVTLNAGTLLVNGSNSGAGGYTVNAGAILGGTGSIAGPVSVAAGGIIEPGDSPGTLSTGALSLVGGSTMTYELDAPNTVGGGVNDLVAITGNLSLPASGVVVNIVGLPGFNLQPGGTTYTLMTYTGSLTGSAASFQLGFAPGMVTGATFDTTSEPGAVLITVVPTPGSFGLLGMAGLLAARRRRR
jgi:autotransporter-associated beta strand protein